MMSAITNMKGVTHMYGNSPISLTSYHLRILLKKIADIGTLSQLWITPLESLDTLHRQN